MSSTDGTPLSEIVFADTMKELLEYSRRDVVPEQITGDPEVLDAIYAEPQRVREELIDIMLYLME